MTKFSKASLFFVFGWNAELYETLPSDVPLFFALFPDDLATVAKYEERTRNAKMCVLDQGDKALQNIEALFTTHEQIADLAGTVFLGDTENPLARRVMQRLATRFEFLGNDVEDTFIGYENAKKNAEFLRTAPRSSDLRGLGKGKTAICVAAGPSVTQHMRELHRLQHSCTIICADSMLAGLLERGIEPDIVTSVERPPQTADMLRDSAPQCKTKLVALPVTDREIAELFAGRTAFWWNGDKLYEWLDPEEPRLMSGRSTGVLGVALAGHMGFSRAYLVGHDLCYDGEASHSDAAHDIAHVKQSPRNNQGERDLWIPGNAGLDVRTTYLWQMFRDDLAMICQGYKGTEFINTNIAIGAVIPGTTRGCLPAMHHSEKLSSWPEQRERHLPDFDNVATQWQNIAKHFMAVYERMDDPAKCEDYAAELEVCDTLFQYVFRACLRNIMVRLRYDNTQVTTDEDVAKNHLYALRRYAYVVPQYIEAFKERA